MGQEKKGRAREIMRSNVGCPRRELSLGGMISWLTGEGGSGEAMMGIVGHFSSKLYLKGLNQLI